MIKNHNIDLGEQLLFPGFEELHASVGSLSSATIHSRPTHGTLNFEADVNTYREMVTRWANSAAENKNWAAVVLLYGLAAESLAALLRLASKGNMHAARRLLSALRRAIRQLNSDAQRNPAPYRVDAGIHLNWPILFSPIRYLSTDTEALREKLRIGDNLYVKLGNKRAFDLKSPKNRLALYVVQTLAACRLIESDDSLPDWKKECLKLRDFGKTSYAEWARVGFMMVSQQTLADFRMKKLLYDVGKHRLSKAKYKKSEQSYVYEGVREELLEALKKMAPPTQHDRKVKSAQRLPTIPFSFYQELALTHFSLGDYFESPK